MSNPVEPRPGAWVTRLTGLGAVVAALLLLVLPSAFESAQAGVATEENRSAFDAAAAASAPNVAAPLRYRLRCWQHGRLVIEESGIELPAGSVKLRAIDARRQPVTLLETNNATCLVRPMAAEPAR
jgi:hypothetical protein